MAIKFEIPSGTNVDQITIDGYEIDLSDGATINQVLQYDGSSFIAANIAGGGTLPFVIANEFSGSDIGAQINNACAALSNGGTIRVLDGYYIIETQVVLVPNIKLILGAGEYANTMFGLPVFLLDDNCQLIGSPGTIVLESQDGTISPEIGLVYCVATVNEWLPSLDHARLGNSNLLIADIEFGRAANTVDADTGVIQLSNVQGARIERCFFNAISCFGPTIGGSSADGYYAESVWITDCRFDNVGAQNVAVVNAVDFHIESNTFNGISRNDLSTYIDCETNTDTDKMQFFTITNNIINITPSDTIVDINAGAAIQVAGQVVMNADLTQPYLSNAAFGVISGNIITGHLYPIPNGDTVPGPDFPYYPRLGQGIFLTHCSNIQISDNNVRGISNEPITLTVCRNCHVSDNHLTTCGGSASSINLRGSQNCKIEGNSIVEEDRPYWLSQPGITEFNGGEYDVDSDANIVCNNDLAYYPSTPDDESLAYRHPTVDLYGPNSRAFNNRYNGLTSDIEELQSVAELRLLPYPGTRNADVPPAVKISGSSLSGDGGSGLYVFNYSSNANDNGFTIINPHNPYPNPDAYGRWIRETETELIANYFPGSDIGAQINNAMATIPNGGTVRILDGYYVISTQVIMSPNSTLLIGVGIIDCGLFNTGVPVILMQDNCTIEGTGNGSQIRESIQHTNLALVISDYKNWLPAQDAAVDGNSNLAVRKLHFIPQEGGDEIVGQSGIIAFFNSHNTLVESCFFDNIHMYGVEIGGLSSDGYCGDRAIITNNVFQGLWSQNIGVVNATNVICDGNIFTGTQNVAVTYIDFEINSSMDKMQMFSICNNIINIMPNIGSGDGYNDFIQPGAAINITGDGDEGPTDNSTFFASNGAFGIVSNNVINGGLYPFTPGTIIDGELRYYAEGFLTQGITILGCQNIEISNNILYLVNDSPIYLSYARMCSVHNNRLINCGITESLAHTITLYGSSGNAIENNVISGMQGFYVNTIPSIVEQDSGDGRPTDFNIFKGNILQRYPTDGTAGGYDAFPGEDPYILTIGPNSRVYSTSIFGVEMDAAEIESVAQLRHLSMPGARGSTAAPPVVRVGGGLNQGDGGGALYIWNADGYGEDGLTIITPTRLYPAEGPGRWNRAPSTIHMTTAQRDGYSFGSSVAGLEIYNTDDGYFQFWNGSAWGDFGQHNTFATIYDNTPADNTISINSSGGKIIIQDAYGYSGFLLEVYDTARDAALLRIGNSTTDTQFFSSKIPDGSSTPCFTFSPTSAIFTSGQTIVSILKDGEVEVLAIDKDGFIKNPVSNKLLSSNADGSSSVAAIIDTTTAWSTAGSKLFSIRNGGAEVLYVDTVTWGGCGIYSTGSQNGIFNTTTGAIDSGLYINGANLFFMSGASQVMDFNWSTGLIPHADLGIPLGGSGNRWSAIWSESYAGIHHNVSSSGAVAINTQLGEMCVLTSSASISGITLAAGLPAQLFTLELVQGNTSYTWPTTIVNARLTGGTFTKSATTGQVDTITFRYNATNSTWDELSRSLAIS